MSSPPNDSIRHQDPVPPPQSAPGVFPGLWLSETQSRMARKSISEERTPLLFKPPTENSSRKDDGDIVMVRDEIENHSGTIFKFESLKILKMSCPVIFAYILQNS